MALGNFRNLLGPHEHPFYLGALVGAAHPTLDPHVGASAWTEPRHGRGEVPDRKPDPGMMGVERGYDHLAHLALGNRLAAAGPHDFKDEVLIDDHAFTPLGFIGNQAKIGRAKRLIRIDATRFNLVLQRFWKGST